MAVQPRTVLRAVLVAVTALAMAGCQEILDQAGIEGEDRERLEELGEALEDSFNDEFDTDLDLSGDDPWDDEEFRRHQNPDWAPDDLPPPPVDPEFSASDEDMDFDACGQTGMGGRGGMASYSSGDSDAVHEHYEEYYGRAGEEGQDESGSYTGWDDAETDTSVRIYEDAEGTHVLACANG